MDVSIIIVNYNTKDLLVNCLNSIYEKTKDVLFEIIIVDNASIDGSEEMIKNDFKEVVFIQSGDNIGFGRANNLGIKEAKGDCIFLLNSDTILLNNAIKELTDYLVRNQSVGVCGGNLYDIYGKEATSFSQFMPTLLSDINMFLGGFIPKLLYGVNVSFNNTGSSLLIDGFITGADMMIRKSVLDEVGMFDPDFFMYYEETELTWRIRRKGYKVASVPEARIIHLEGASEIVKENTLRRFAKSKYLYFEKTNQQHYLKYSYLIFLLTFCTRIVYFYLRGNKERINYWFWLLNLIKEENHFYKKQKRANLKILE